MQRNRRVNTSCTPTTYQCNQWCGSNEPVMMIHITPCVIGHSTAGRGHVNSIQFGTLYDTHPGPTRDLFAMEQKDAGIKQLLDEVDSLVGKKRYN